MLRVVLLVLPALLLLVGSGARAAEVGHWRLDEGTGTAAADASGAGNHGTLIGGAAWGAGQLAGALHFDGTTARVRVPDAASLDLAGRLTVAAWVRPDKLATQYLVKKAEIGFTDGYELALSSGGKWFARFNQATRLDAFKASSTSSYPINAATWMHVAVTFDGASIRLYTNGVLETSLAAPGLVLANNALDLALGAAPGGTSGFKGSLDDVRIFDAALSAGEIATVMAGGTPAPDADGDGVPDATDAFPNDPSESADRDGDGTGDNADLDDDNDGMPDAWELLHGFDPTAAADAALDADGDGATNLAEFLRGSDPRVADAAQPIAHWRLDETGGSAASDASGNGRVGSLVGTPDWRTDGRIAGALGFGSGTSRVTVADAAALDLTNALTLAAWMRPSQLTTQYLLKKARSSTNGYELSLSSGGKAFVRFNNATSGNSFRLESVSSYPSNGSTWMHVAATFDGSSIRLYVNGVLESSLAAPGLLVGSNALALALGAQDDGASPFRGTLDDVRIYAQALGAAEVQALFTGAGTPTLDSDGDGVPDAQDAFPNNPAESRDTDHDGIGDNADLDDDGDGLPDAWETAQGLDPLSAADAALDTDGDGFSNLDEYLHGTDPHMNPGNFRAGQWKLDEASGTVASDSSPAGNHGALSGTPLRVAGRYGNALRFDSSDDRVLVPDRASLDLTTRITLAAWIRPTALATQYLVKKARSSTNGYELGLSSGGKAFVRFNNASSANTYRVESTANYPRDGVTWMHLAATFDGASIRLYVNGALDKTLAANGLAIGANNLALAFGAQDDGASPFNGTLDDVNLYGAALGAWEIQRLMSGVNLNPDSDGDGVVDELDLFPNDPGEWADFDHDGTGDNADLDDDNDGMSDAFEVQYGLDPHSGADAGLDPDGDGVANLGEFLAGTHPFDRDGDFVADAQDAFPNDPSEWADADHDAIGDNADLDDDNDGMPDAWELQYGFNPTDASDAGQDADLDGATNLAEYLAGTHPRDRDGDGVSDSNDAFPTDPSEWLDTDGDQIGNNADLDDDGDGLPDAWEIQVGLNPLDASDAAGDPDGDGLDNRGEYALGTDPFVNLALYEVGHWTLDEGAGALAGDSSGHANHGALVGPPLWAPGVDGGSALELDGVDDHVVVPHSASLDLTGPITLMGWVRPAATTTQYLLKKARVSASNGYELGLSSAGKVFVRFNQLTSGNSFRVLSLSSYPADGLTWIHVAASYDGQSIRLYVNSVLEGTLAAPGLAIASNALPLGIGAEDAGAGPFHGTLDALHVYSRGLTAADVHYVMQRDLPPDADHDGTPDAQDAFPNDPNERADSDHDGVGNNADLDDDNDGMPDWFELQKQLDPQNPSDAALDSDGDGVSNLAEYLAGTDPRDDLNDRLAASWRMDEGSGTLVHDDSGFANDGTTAGAPSWVPGVKGSALSFNGSTDRVVVHDSPSLDATTGITLAAWIRPSRAASQFMVKKSRSSSDGYELSLSSGGKWFVRFNSASLGDLYKISSTSNYPTNGTTWMHVAGSFDGQTIRLYTNGVLETSVAAPGLRIGANSRDLGIGAQDDGKSAYAGALDQVRVHASALSQEKIQALIAADTLPPLESWVATPIAVRSTSATSGEKPQSKVWTQGGSFFSVFPDATGTWLWRLDGTGWTALRQLSSRTTTHADNVVDYARGLVHVMLFDGASSELVSLQYAAGSPPSYSLWSVRPASVLVALPSAAETSTLALDSTGRLWLVYDTASSILVRYADLADDYGVWSSPFSIASGVDPDDIGDVVAFHGQVGVFWSDQVTQRFGFRIHRDVDAPATWSADEVPAGATALPVGAGQADDHVNMVAASDGTLYVCVKTGYDHAGYPAVALLVRHVNGTWDGLYTVDELGTRGIVVLNEAIDQLMVIYTQAESGGAIEYKLSNAHTIAFGPRQVLMPGLDLNDPSSVKTPFLGKLVVIATTHSSVGRELHAIALTPP